MKDLKTILILIFIYIGIIATTFSCIKREVKEEVKEKVEVKGYLDNYEYSSDDPVIEITTRPEEIEATPPRYWYVYYSTNVKSGRTREWRGYKVIKLNTSYFHIINAIKEIYKEANEKDYIGIEFFKEVSKKTYDEYMKSDGR